MLRESIQKLVQATLFVLLLAMLPFAANSTTYTAVVAGNWSSALTWGGNAPGSNITGAHQIVIAANVTVTMDVDVTINNPLATMTLLGNVQSAGHELVLTAGTVAGTGDLILHQLTVGAMGAIATTGEITVGTLETASTALTLQADLQVQTMLTISAGNFSIANSGSLMLDAGATINMAGGIFLAGQGAMQTAGDINLMYTGPSSTTGAEADLGTIANLTVQLSNSNQNLSLDDDLTVTDSLRLLMGHLVLSGNQLTVTGTVQHTAQASITGDTNAGLVLDGTGNVSLVFSLNGSLLDSLTVSQTGGNVSLNSDLTVQTAVNLQQGTLTLNGNDLTINGSLTTAVGASIMGSATSGLTLDGTGNMSLVFAQNGSMLSNLTVSQAGGNVSLNSDLSVNGALVLQEGNLVLGANDLTLAAGALIEGGSENSYIMTNGQGELLLLIEAGSDGVLFPCGTDQGYFPSIISQNQGAANAHIGVSVATGVFAEGETGSNLTVSESLVDHTWFISSTDANAQLDLDFQFFWNANAEVNSFNHDACYISHYVNGAWDNQAFAQANVEADGYFSVRREHITSLSPFKVTSESALATSAKVLAEFEAYPNPANEMMFLKLPVKLHAQVAEIFDGTGTLVGVHKMEPGIIQRIDLTKLQPGLYLLQMEGAAPKRFVKMKG